MDAVVKYMYKMMMSKKKKIKHIGIPQGIISQSKVHRLPFL